MRTLKTYEDGTITQYGVMRVVREDIPQSYYVTCECMQDGVVIDCWHEAQELVSELGYETRQEAMEAMEEAYTCLLVVNY